MEEESVVVDLPQSLGDGSNDTIVVPSTPPPQETTTLMGEGMDDSENIPPTEPETVVETMNDKNVRKSTRARKPAKKTVPQTETDEATTKPSTGPRKYTKRKSIVGGVPPEDGGAVVPPPAKKTRRKSIATPSEKDIVTVIPHAPVVSAPIIESADADAPPIMITAESFVLPAEPKKPKKKKEKWIPSDVPPIAGLPRRYDPHAKKVKKVKKVEANGEKTDDQTTIDQSGDPLVVVEPQSDEIVSNQPMITTEGPADADAPPPAPYEPPPQPPAASIEAQPVLQPSPTPAKKLTPFEMSMKNQPSVLKFFVPSTKVDSSPNEETTEGAISGGSPMRDIKSSSRPSSPTPAKPERVIRPPPQRPEMNLYVTSWKEVKRLPRPKTVRQFYTRDVSNNIRYLERAEIAPRKTTVYAGDNPVHRLRLKKLRPVYIAIHDRERPPVKLIIAHASTGVSGRHPLGTDPIIDYERDSDDEWAEENDGEDLNSNAEDDEEEEIAVGQNLDDEDAQSENSFFVSDGHFSEDEALSDDEAVVARRRRNEMSVDSEGKSTLQLIVFSPADLETRDTDYSSEPSHAKWFNLLWNEAVVQVYDESHYFAEPVVQVVEKVKAQKIEKPPKPEKPVIDKTELAKFVHGKIVNIDSLIADYRVIHPELSANALKTEVRSIASWSKKPELMPRIAWFVKPELFTDLGLVDEEMMALIVERRALAVVAAPAAAKPPPVTAVPPVQPQNVLPFKPIDSEPVDAEQRANLHN